MYTRLAKEYKKYNKKRYFLINDLSFNCDVKNSILFLSIQGCIIGCRLWQLMGLVIENNTSSVTVTAMCFFESEAALHLNTWKNKNKWQATCFGWKNNPFPGLLNCQRMISSQMNQQCGFEFSPQRHEQKFDFWNIHSTSMRPQQRLAIHRGWVKFTAPADVILRDVAFAVLSIFIFQVALVLISLLKVSYAGTCYWCTAGVTIFFLVYKTSLRRTCEHTIFKNLAQNYKKISGNLGFRAHRFIKLSKTAAIWCWNQDFITLWIR